MKSKLLYFAMLTVGAAIGSGVTWYITKERYKKIADEEIESVKVMFSKKEKDLKKDLDEAHDKLKFNAVKEREAETIIQESHVAVKRDYTQINPNDITITKDSLEKVEVKNMNEPHIITQDEFGEIDDYDIITLMYYADEHLADEDDELVDDIESVIGYDSLTHFGNDDAIYVRNDRLKCDYEILRDERKFADILNGIA